MHTFEKLIIAGNFFHHYLYSKAVHYDFQQPKYQKNKRKGQDLRDRNDSNIYRTKKRIKLLLQANTDESSFGETAINQPLFLTLTFMENIQEVDKANKLFSRFIRAVNYQSTKSKKATLKYLNVIEFQQRGAIHFHCVIFNPGDRFKLYDIIREQWPYGFTSLKVIKNQQHLINYVYKDLVKNRQKAELYGHKSYFISKGLKQPTIFRDSQWISALLPSDKKQTFSKTFTNDHQSTKYTMYKLETSELPNIDLNKLQLL